MTVVTLTERPKSVHMQSFWWRFFFLYCHVAFLDFSGCVGVFVIGLSQISSCFS